MLEQLKRDRIAQAMLGVVVLVGCAACGIWVFSLYAFITRSNVPENASVSAPVGTSTIALILTDTPEPPQPTWTRESTVTPRAPTPPRSGIPATRQDLVNHFDRKGFRWREATYNDGTYQLVGEAQNGSGKIVMWSSPDDPEDLIELFYSFTFPFEGGDNIRRTGVEEMFETMRIVLPGWSEGESWIPNALKEEGDETIVNGMEVSIEWGPEEPTQQFIVIFSVVE